MRRRASGYGAEAGFYRDSLPGCFGVSPGKAMSIAWNGRPALKRPRLVWTQRLRGGIRLFAFLVGTMALMPAFLLLRVTGGSRDRWVAMIWSRLALACLGLRIKVRGTPVGSGVLAANHANWIDPLVIGAAARSFFVAKREVRGWPGIGFLCWLGRVEFISRVPTEARRQVKHIERRLCSGHLLCIFPEGTTTDGRRVLPFRSSLFAPPLAIREGCEVQPILIYYQPPAGELPDSFYGWWGDSEFLDHMWDVACRSVRGTVSVEFLPALHSTAFSDRKTLAAACGDEIVPRMAAHASAARLACANARPLPIGGDASGPSLRQD